MQIERIGNPSKNAEEFVAKLKNSNTVLNSAGDSNNILLANFSSVATNMATDSIKQTLEKEGALLFLENVKKEHFPDNALLSVDADYCVIKSMQSGRVQHVLCSSPAEPGPVYIPAELKNIEAEIDEKGQIINVKDSPITESDIKKSALTAETMSDTQLEEWLELINLKSNQLQEHPDMQLVNASLMRGSITIQEQTYKSYLSWGKETLGSIYCSYDIELAAVIEPKKNKILKFTSVNSFVRIQKMGRNEDWCKGDGTSLGSLRIYPGDRATFELDQVPLPKGWRITKIAPETKNSDNSYTRTTGYSVGASGGGEIAKDPKIAANLSFNYSSSQQYSETFQDFTATNGSSSSYCFWEYKFTKLYRDWESLFHGIQSRPEQFPELARTTMYLKNEVAYEIPQDDNRNQHFYIFQCQFRVCLWSRFPKIGYNTWGDAQRWNGFSINLGAVKFKS